MALDNLQNQLGHIGLRNPDAALSHSRRVEGAIVRLLDHPLIGRAGRRPGTRKLVVARTPFLVVYRVEDDVIVIPSVETPRSVGLRARSRSSAHLDAAFRPCHPGGVPAETAP